MLHKKKVIFQLPSLELGGAERQALLLACHLKKQGADVEVWGFHKPGRVVELCDRFNIAWRSVNPPLSFGPVTGSNTFTRFLSYTSRRARRIISLLNYTLLLRKAKVDVLLPYTMDPNMICGLVWKKTGARVCIWNQRDEGRGRMGREVEKSVIPRIPAFVSNSQHGAEFLIRELGADPNLVHVIHNGIEMEQPELGRAEWRAKLGVGEDCFLTCMVGNFTKYKDHATLIKAWGTVVDELNKAHQQARLILAGRFDKNYPALAALVREMNLEHNVNFIDKVKDIAGLLAAVDLGVHSSKLEGCPNSVLEMMAAGLTVIGTDIPGIREAIGSDRDSCLSLPDDEAGLAERILTFASQPELRAEQGKINLERIEREFSSQSMCEQMVKLIMIDSENDNISRNFKGQF